MKITAITKFKQGDLYLAMKSLGWSQTELAKRSGISINSIRKIINLKSKPSEKTANKIQQVLALAGEYVDVATLWPKEFDGFSSRLVMEQTQDINMQHFISKYSGNPLIEMEKQEMEKTLWDKLEILPDREKTTIIDRFYHGKTLMEVATKLKLSYERVRQIERRALNKLQREKELRYLSQVSDDEIQEHYS